MVPWAGATSAEFDLFSRLLVGLIFIAAGAAKALRPRSELQQAINGYRLLPRAITPAVAAMLPISELLVGVLLVLDVARPIPAAAAGVLLLTFAAAGAVNLGRGRRISCGCYGSLVPDASLSWTLVMRNTALAAVAANVAMSSADDSLEGSHALAVVLVAAAVLVGGMLIHTIWRLVKSPSPRMAATPGDGAAHSQASPRLLRIGFGRETHG